MKIPSIEQQILQRIKDTESGKYKLTDKEKNKNMFAYYSSKNKALRANNKKLRATIKQQAEVIRYLKWQQANMIEFVNKEFLKGKQFNTDWSKPFIVTADTVSEVDR